MANTETKNYVLGRGDLYFAQKRADGTLAGERMIGNTPDFSLSMSSNSVKHYSSARGIRTQDREVPISVDYSAKYTTDDVNGPNLANLFFGSAETVSVTAITNGDETFTDVEQGLAYQLGMSVANPAGIQQVSTVVVKVGTDVQVLNTDYTLDTALGRVVPVVGGGIADGDNMQVTWHSAAQSQERVASSNTPVEGALRFISFNAEGEDRDWYLPDVKLTPNGDLAIKADQDWQKVPFNVSIQTPTDRPAVNVNGRAFTG
jgi:hypothetical protein